MSTDWIKYKRLNWPKGSLERELAKREAKSLTEAVQAKVKENNELRELKKQLEEAEGEGFEGDVGETD